MSAERLAEPFEFEARARRLIGRRRRDASLRARVRGWRTGCGRRTDVWIVGLVPSYERFSRETFLSPWRPSRAFRPRQHLEHTHS